MPQAIAFIDGGFLKGQGAKRLQARPRDVKVIPTGIVEWAREQAAQRGDTLLRVYWYDGQFDPADPRHASQRAYFDALRMCPGIQMRLGYLQEITPGWQNQVKKAIQACGWDLATFEQHFQFQPKLEQKGVDTLIVLDIVRLAQRGTYDSAILVCGDRDVAEAVWAAQDVGCHLVVAHPGGGGVSTELRHLADEVRAISDEDLRRMLQVKPQLGSTVP